MADTGQAAPEPEQGFVPNWSEKDRGILDDNGRALEHCTPMFIIGLLQATMNAYGFRTGAEREILADVKRSTSILDIVSNECRRLQLHPSLYYSIPAQVVFGNTMNEINARADDALGRAFKNAGPEAVKPLSDSQDRFIEAMNCPSFKPGLQPWEQFLLPGSPGCGVVLPDVPPGTEIRLLPPGYIKIFADWAAKANSLRTAIHQTNIPENLQLANLSFGELPDTSRIEDATSGAPHPIERYQHVFEHVTLTPNIFYEVIKTNRRHDDERPESLLSLGRFLDRLEGLPDPVQDRQAFPAILVRSTKIHTHGV